MLTKAQMFCRLTDQYCVQEKAGCHHLVPYSHWRFLLQQSQSLFAPQLQTADCPLSHLLSAHATSPELAMMLGKVTLACGLQRRLYYMQCLET